MQRKSAGQAALQWDDVRMFLALCRSQTVGRAAAALGVDASTVSRRLAALEAAVDAVLFERGRHGIALTKAAEDLVPVAEEIEQAVLQFGRAAEGLEREVAGVVRVTCPADVAEVVVVPCLGELLTRHPALRIELDPSEAVLDLTRREADIALRVVRPTRGDLLVTRLLSLRWVAVAAPAVAGQLGTLRNWSDAAWIGWGERSAHVGPARWLEAHVRDVQPVVRSDSLRLQLAALTQGLGVGLMPEPSVQHYGLTPVKFAASLREAAAQWPTNELFLVTHRVLRDVPRVRVVWDLLVERVGQRGVKR